MSQGSSRFSKTSTFFSENLIQEVLERLVLSDVVKTDVRLARKGHEWLGLCPFHNEKTPSFTVNDQKGLFYCFGCAEKGNAISYLMKRHGRSFADVMEDLASKAGVALPLSREEDTALNTHNDTLKIILKEASLFYMNQLQRNPECLQYLDKRGVTLSTALTFGLGYAKHSSDLHKFLMKKGYKKEEIARAGLLNFNPSDDPASFKGSIKDRFFERLMFPINDARGDVVGFGGRTLNEKILPKYMNSAETDVFKKGHLLYGYHLARPNLTKEQGFVLVEGYMDVISLWQAGCKTAVAPLGTALTEDQLKLLWRHGGCMPTICFDGDAAGKKAAYRAVDRALPFISETRSLRFCFFDAESQTKEDPDSFIRSYGASAFLKKLALSKSFSDVFWKYCLSQVSFDISSSVTPEQKTVLAKLIKEQLHRIQDPCLRQFYDDEFYNRQKKMWRDLFQTDGVFQPPERIKQDSLKEGRLISRKRPNERGEGYISPYLFETDKISKKKWDSKKTPERYGVKLPALPNISREEENETRLKLLFSVVLWNCSLLEYVQESLSMLQFSDHFWENAKQKLLNHSLLLDFDEAGPYLKNLRIESLGIEKQLELESQKLLALYAPFVLSMPPVHELLVWWEALFEFTVIRHTVKKEEDSLIQDLRTNSNDQLWEKSWQRFCELKKREPT